MSNTVGSLSARPFHLNFNCDQQMTPSIDVQVSRLLLLVAVEKLLPLDGQNTYRALSLQCLRARCNFHGSKRDLWVREEGA